jgi:hypothetical protein
LVIVSKNKNNINETTYALEIFFRKAVGSSFSALKSYKGILPSEMGRGDLFSDVIIKKEYYQLKIKCKEGLIS